MSSRDLLGEGRELIILHGRMMRADPQRALLFDLDTAIQPLSVAVPDNLAQLTSVYHNLLRQWADT